MQRTPVTQLGVATFTNRRRLVDCERGSPAAARVDASSPIYKTRSKLVLVLLLHYVHSLLSIQPGFISVQLHTNYYTSSNGCSIVLIHPHTMKKY